MGKVAASARACAVAAGVAYLVVGVPWFVRPAWSAERFPWGVTAFMAMTIGAWCLGNAWWVWCAVRTPAAEDARALWGYLAAFGVLQLGVAAWFADKLRTEEWTTWPYLAALVLSALAGILGLVATGRATATGPVPGDPEVPGWARGFVWFFVVFVGFLAAVAAWSPPRARSGAVFPEPMTPFTLRAFGAFYLSLAVGAVLLLPVRRARAVVAYGTAGLGLVALITLTLPFYADVFDIGEHPLQIVYVAAYVGVLVVDIAGLTWYRRHREPFRGRAADDHDRPQEPANPFPP